MNTNKPKKKWKRWHKIFVGFCAVFVLFIIVVISTAKDAPIKSETTQQNEVTVNYNDSALLEIRKEKAVKEAIITDADVLYVSVYDDGTRRDGYADYICQILKEHQATVKRVKVVKFGSAKDPNRDNAYGILLGESYCK